MVRALLIAAVLAVAGFIAVMFFIAGCVRVNRWDE